MSTVDTLIDRFSAFATADPNARVEKGVERDLDQLPDPSLEHASARVREARSILEDIETTQRSRELAFDEQIDLDLAALHLEGRAHQLELSFGGARELTRQPTLGRDVGDGIFLMLAQDDRPAAERLRDILGRIEQIPEYVSALLGRLVEPVERWAEMDLERTRGLSDLFDTAQLLSQETGFADAGRLKQAVEKALSALERYEKALAALPTTRSFHVGRSCAERIVELRGIDESLDTLHGWAKGFLEKNAEEVETLRARLTRKYDLDDSTSAAELHHALSERYRLPSKGQGFSHVLARYEKELELIVSFIQEHDLFPIPADQSLEILETPSFMKPVIPAGAMMSPPPFRPGHKKSLVYLTLSEELLDEHTELSIPSMMIHEGIPGHHLQLTAAAMHPSVVRRHIEAMDQAEGWTTMLEDYMLDVGYRSETADELRFIGKREIARIGARVAIDLFFMSGDRTFLDVGLPVRTDAEDPFEAAGALLGAVTGFVPGRIRAELGWYSQERGYPLSYLTGNQLVWKLRRDVARHLGGGLDADRRFHRAFLDAGSMPVAVLRRVMARGGLLPER